MIRATMARNLNSQFEVYLLNVYHADLVLRLTLTSGTETRGEALPFPAPTTLSSDALASSLVLVLLLPGLRTPLLRRLTRALIRIGTSTLRRTIEAPRLVSRLCRRSCGRVSSPPTTIAVEARKWGFGKSAGVSLRPRDSGGGC